MTNRIRDEIIVEEFMVKDVPVQVLTFMSGKRYKTRRLTLRKVVMIQPYNSYTTMVFMPKNSTKQDIIKYVEDDI